jgi:hypothetical protein
MAGVKITDLELLTTPVASDDLLYIVDVSDTTESPQGTSKSIEVGNMAGFESGSYTPTISGQTNGILVSPISSTYIKIKNIVSVSAQLDIQLASAENTGTFQIELPVASNFTNSNQCFGLMQWSYGGILAEIVGLTIESNSINNTCIVGLSTATDNIQLLYAVIQFQYQII